MESDSTKQPPQSLFPQAPVRQPPWLRFLAWMEFLGGAIGLLVYFGVSVAYPTFLPTWHHLLAVAFFGANIVAGILLVQERENGLVLSFIVQLLQVVFWNSGVAWVARAGLHITPLIASTGFGVFAGPASEFFSFPVDTTSFSPGSGLGFILKLGFFWKPLSDATFACGVNLVALFFSVRLWRQLSTSAPVKPPQRRAEHPAARWALPAAVAVIALVGLFMLFSGPKSINRPVTRWASSSGDTLDILWSGVWYEAGVGLVDKSVTAGRFFLVRYRSDFHDRSRDRANSAALAQLVCHQADSLGVKRILVRPTKTAFAGLVTTSLNYWSTVDTAAHCSEAAP